MDKTLFQVAIPLLLASGPFASLPSAVAPSQLGVLITIETSLGTIVLDIDSVHAPITATNFLRYVDGGFYDGGSFHRSVRLDNQPRDSIRIEVVQAAINRDRRRDGWDPIPLEGTLATGLAHTDGVVSMARAGPDTARSGFFICIGDQPELDEGGARHVDLRGFAAFGRVVRGMDVVRSIQTRPTNGQTLIEPVRIISARRN